MNKEQLKISIIIPTCNRPDLLATCLNALKAENGENQAADLSPPYELEVIVSNDGDETQVYKDLKKNHPHIKWLPGPRQGPAANRNHGARAASGSWLVFLDDDCIPESGWIKAFVNARMKADVLEGKTIADRPKRSLKEESPINEQGGLLWSCNFALKRELFFALRGFDESFPSAAMEDVDFRERLKARGTRIVFVADAVVVHPWRTAKGWRFESRRMKSWEHLIAKHPHLLGKSPARHFFYLGIRGIVRETIPGVIHYRARGCLHALSINCYHLALGCAYGLRLGSVPKIVKK